MCELYRTTAPVLAGASPGLLAGSGLPGPVRADLVQLPEEDGIPVSRYALTR